MEWVAFRKEGEKERDGEREGEGYRERVRKC